MNAVRPSIDDVGAWTVYLAHADSALEQRRRLTQARDAGMDRWTLKRVFHGALRDLYDVNATAIREGNEAAARIRSLQNEFADGFE
jgi:chloramphenicol 3-O-phosphotransferase